VLQCYNTRNSPTRNHKVIQSLRQGRNVQGLALGCVVDTAVCKGVVGVIGELEAGSDWEGKNADDDELQ
jgi:hypothetical protein